MKTIIEKNFSSLKIINLGDLGARIECPKNDECFLKQIANFASPQNIKKIWENHSNALEEVLVARKDVSIPYEIMTLMEEFSFGILGERVVEDRGISKKMCVRYPPLEKEKNEDVHPVQIVVDADAPWDRCDHVRNSPWLLFLSTAD